MTDETVSDRIDTASTALTSVQAATGFAFVAVIRAILATTVGWLDRQQTAAMAGSTDRVTTSSHR